MPVWCVASVRSADSETKERYVKELAGVRMNI